MAELKIGRVRIGWKGTWSAASAYVSQDCVFYGGESFVALQAVPAGTATTNATYWQKIAQKGADGANGTNGAQGPQGVKGDTGAQGPQGIQGTTGLAPAHSWTGSTLTFKNPNGTDGAATNLIGPQGVAGPQGPQGLKGDTGNTGATGPQGPQGIQGPTGLQGPAGVKGDTGSQGAQGTQGVKGDPGNPGAAATVSVGTVTTGASGSSATVTNSGNSSAATFNFTIPQGATGATGAQGPAGSTSYDAGTAIRLTNAWNTWANTAAKDNVVGMLTWKNYGNNHVIFDASNSTAPNGAAVNNTTPSAAWSASYPTLMGWNGSSTYGVRVDRAATAEYAWTAGNAIGYGQSWTDVTGSRSLSTSYTNSTGRPITVLAQIVVNGGTTCSVTLNGVTAAMYGSAGVNFGAPISFVVPAGHSYSISNAGATLNKWLELR